MLEYVEIILYPVILGMDFILNLYIRLFHSAGFSVIFLSLTVSTIFVPIQRMARKVETRIAKKMELVEGEVKELKKSLKGEELFFATEAVYKKANYHPIQSIMLGASFWVLLPVLLSAIFLFKEYHPLLGVNFLFIKDLSKPDQWLLGINLLPILMFVITLLDAGIRFSQDSKRKLQFLFLSVVLSILVYSMPAALVMYWSVSNIVSLLLTVTKKIKKD